LIRRRWTRNEGSKSSS